MRRQTAVIRELVSGSWLINVKVFFVMTQMSSVDKYVEKRLVRYMHSRKGVCEIDLKLKLKVT